MLILLISWVGEAGAAGVFVGPDGKHKKTTLNLAFPFYNEKFGAALGYVYGITGWPQPQSALLTTTMAGTAGSGMVFLVARDLQLPGTRRWFVDPVTSVGFFKDNQSYISGNPDFPDEQAGSNDSDPDNFIEGDGWDNFIRIRFKYLLPIGYGKDNIISTYKLSGGHLIEGATGAKSMNPFTSGTTFLEFRPFYRSQEIDGDDIDSTLRTNGIDASIYWDNRDFFANPKHGNSWRLKASRDFGAMDSSGLWTSLQGEVDQYFSLGETDLFSHRVLALDIWTSHSPSWDEQNSGEIDNRPPAYTGATLGGLWKMRGYPSQRFSDRSAIYYCAELRLTSKWNPFDNWDWIQKYLGVQWVQVVPFVEAGRVAEEWTPDTLHSDMKIDGGLGFRVLAKGIVARIDVAGSDEGFTTQMIINQPFQF
jgi:hypothetical protein